ncbi:MAG: HAMP domain-containing histidine kinase [Candidatus Pacebacteria bacterium]|nr:HAMP domain-containing histidine kinase [Candidatus Paceibacterota bacterium]
MIRKLFRKVLQLSGCQKYNLPLWECPSFLFALMGAINILSCVYFYFLGSKYIEDPRLVAFGVLTLAAIWFVISFAITRGLEELLEVNKVKEEFIDIVSHQLRTPLTNLKWAAQFLITKKRSPEEEEYYTIIKENSQRLESLLNDLLIVARLREDGIFKIQEKFSLNELIDETIRAHLAFAKASNVSIEIENLEEPIFLSTNRTMLKTAIGNLINNAITYNKPKGKVKIKVKKEPKRIIIAVEDTGTGISKKDQKYLFQKFFRGENASQINTRGTGLGLYIVKEVMKKLGGRVWYKTKQGKGSTFFISLKI